MTDRPILFSAPMVCALLDGRKVQTRRILKPQPPEWATFCEQPDMFNVERRWVPSGLWRWSEPQQSPPRALRAWPIDAGGEHYWLQLPWRVGDRLWVKETWRTSICQDAIKPSIMETPGNGYGWPVWYEADGGAVTWRGSNGGGPGFETPGKRRPSLFMSRWASRLTLAVTQVRVERLHDISEADAVAEGMPDFGTFCETLDPGKLNAAGETAAQTASRLRWPQRWFAALWNEINGDGAWAANPWVVATTFTVHHANIDTPALGVAA